MDFLFLLLHQNFIATVDLPVVCESVLLATEA